MENQSIHLNDTLKAGVFSSILSALINFGLFFYGQENDAFGDGIAVNQTTDSALTAVEIVTLSVIAPLVAAILYWLIGKIFTRAKLVFFILSVVVFALFVPGPLELLDNTTDLTIVLLEIMHAVVAVLTLFFMFTMGSSE